MDLEHLEDYDGTCEDRMTLKECRDEYSTHS